MNKHLTLHHVASQTWIFLDFFLFFVLSISHNTLRNKIFGKRYTTNLHVSREEMAQPMYFVHNNKLQKYIETFFWKNDIEDFHH